MSAKPPFNFLHVNNANSPEIINPKIIGTLNTTTPITGSITEIHEITGASAVFHESAVAAHE